MSNFWLISGNGTRVRFFRGASPQASLEEVESLVNPVGGLTEHNLVSDRPGRNVDGIGPARSAIGETDRQDRSMDEFAGRIAEYLHQRKEAGELERASIVVSPAMLGRLRPKLTKAVRDVILEEVAKDLTSADAAQVQAVLTQLS